MKLRASKQELLEKLSDIQNIVEKRNTMPILSHFLLDASAGGAFIMATDLETAIKEPLDVSAEKEGKLAIPARKLFEIIREVEGDVAMETSDSQWLKVKAGASSFRLACLSADDFPAWPSMEKAEEITMAAAELADMIEKTLFSAGESDTRYTLNGLLFHILPEASSFTMVGTDGHRLSLITKPVAAPVSEEKKVILPRKAASELRKLLDKSESVTLLIGKNHILFKAGPVEFLARLIEGTYPNYSQVIPSNDKKLSIDREAFVKALRRVSIMSRDRSNAVKADISGGLLSLASSNPDLGEASDEIAISYEGEPLTIGFNARYLLDALNAIPTEKVIFEIHDQLSPTLLRKEDSEDYRCVVMPMRI